MANGEEDLREKNKGREKPTLKNYQKWSVHFGREDAEMLQEKVYGSRRKQDGKCSWEND